MENLVKWLFVLLIIINVLVKCERLTCRERSYNLDAACTIVGYVAKLEIDDEFELDAAYQKDKIKNLKFFKSNVTRIPNGIFTDLEYVQVLDLSASNVVIISRVVFVFGHNLRELNLSRNLIKELPESGFDFADNLERIDLSYNQIETIDVHAFNKIERLQKIDLSHNRLKSITSDIFPAFLFELNLDFNLITNFSLSASTNIEQISLNNNQLIYLEVNSRTKSLYANNNFLKSQNIIFRSNTLNSLSLRNNSLQNFNVINNMKNLSYLDLSVNRENTVSNSFNELTNLKTLVLKSTNIKQSDFEHITELYNLETLDVSANNLSFVDFNLISRLENLKYLNLNQNNLYSLTFNEFEYLFPNMAAIDISENNWICSDLIAVLSKLKRLKVRVEIASEYLNTTNSNIRGIECYNFTKITLSDYEHDLETANITELTQMLSELQNNNAELKMQLNVILNQINDTEQDVQPYIDLVELNDLIERLIQEVDTVSGRNQNGSSINSNQLEILKTSLLQNIDSNFSELYDKKIYLLATIQILAFVIVACIIITLGKKCCAHSKNLQNNCTTSKSQLLV